MNDVGWFSVDLADRGITLQSDFFVGIGYDGQNTPTLGIDTVSNGSAYQWDAATDQWMPLDVTAFIRAEVSYPESPDKVSIALSDDLQGMPGETVRVPIQISGITSGGIDSLDLEMTYDPDILHFTGIVTENTSTTDWETDDIDSLRAGRVELEMHGGTRITNDGTLLYFEFLVSPTSQQGDASRLDFGLVLLNGGEVMVEPDPGRFTVFLGIPIQVSVTSYPEVGSEFWVAVNIGDEVWPVNNLFGLSFILRFTQTDLIDVVTPHAVNVIPGDFMGNDVIFFTVVEESNGNISVGLTRKAGQGGVSGSGTVLRALFVSDVSTPAGSGIEFSVTDITTTDVNGNAITLHPISRTVTIGGETAIKNVSVEIPTAFSLKQNFPNPFNPSTTIDYEIPIYSQVRLEIYNLLGAKIKTLVDTQQQPGHYSVVWDTKDENGSTVSGGMYLYRLQAGSYVDVRKMLLIR